MGRAALLLACALVVLFGCCKLAESRGVELSCSIITYGDWDWEVQTSGENRCMQMVRRARQNCGGKALNFIPTHFWYYEGPEANTVDYYCFKSNKTADISCPKTTDRAILSFQEGMTKCMNVAVKLGYTTLEFAPHLDDGTTQGAWRNGLIFDPLVPYKGHSYVDIMLAPLANALAAVITPDITVHFAMQGEMSAAVMYFPESWSQVALDMRALIIAGNPAINPSNILMGVSTNFNKLCACVLMGWINAETYRRNYPAAHATVADRFNNTAIKALYEQMDFFGLASYPAMFKPFSARDLESAIDQFAFEASFFGVNVTDLIYVHRKRLHFSEYGIGGGTCQDGQCAAETATEVALTPYFGVFGPYTRAKDPWRTYMPPTAPVETRDFLRTFYQQTIRWLVNSGGPVYRVDQLYMWNMASWDVLGVYPDSSTDEGSYLDTTLSETIKAWNDEGVIPSEGAF